MDVEIRMVIFASEAAEYLARLLTASLKINKKSCLTVSPIVDVLRHQLLQVCKAYFFSFQ